MAKSPGRSEPSWLDLAEELIDESVEREEAVTITAEDLTVDVPMSFDEGADQARWRFDGEVSVTVDGMRGSFAEWVHLFRRASREDR